MSNHATDSATGLVEFLTARMKLWDTLTPDRYAEVRNTLHQLEAALQAAEAWIVDGGHCETEGNSARNIVAQIRRALGRDRANA